MFYIYGKHQTQKRFRPMNVHKGVQVVNLVHASRFTAEQKEQFMQIEAPRNPDWTFEARPVK